MHLSFEYKVKRTKCSPQKDLSVVYQVIHTFFSYHVVVAAGQHRKVLKLTSSSGLHTSTTTYGSILPEGDLEVGWPETPQQGPALRREKEAETSSC